MNKKWISILKTHVFILVAMNTMTFKEIIVHLELVKSTKNLQAQNLNLLKYDKHCLFSLYKIS